MGPSASFSRIRRFDRAFGFGLCISPKLSPVHASRVHEASSLRHTYYMATTQEIPLGSVDGELEDGGNIRRAELLEQDDTTDSRQGTSPSTKEAAGNLTTSRWKEVSITVTTSVTYLFLCAGISMIGPFYPIEVSWGYALGGEGHFCVVRASYFTTLTKFSVV